MHPACAELCTAERIAIRSQSLPLCRIVHETREIAWGEEPVRVVGHIEERWRWNGVDGRIANRSQFVWEDERCGAHELADRSDSSEFKRAAHERAGGR